MYSAGLATDACDVRVRSAAAAVVSMIKVTECVGIGESGSEFSTPGKVRPTEQTVRNVDEKVAEKIRSIIYEFAKNRKY